jgi:hypothetical protein
MHRSWSDRPEDNALCQAQPRFRQLGKNFRKVLARFGHRYCACPYSRLAREGRKSSREGQHLGSRRGEERPAIPGRRQHSEERQSRPLPSDLPENATDASHFSKNGVGGNLFERKLLQPFPLLGIIEQSKKCIIGRNNFPAVSRLTPATHPETNHNIYH